MIILFHIFFFSFFRTILEFENLKMFSLAIIDSSTRISACSHANAFISSTNKNNCYNDIVGLKVALEAFGKDNNNGSTTPGV